MSSGVGYLVGGRYELIEAVGEGGMGRVWRGRDQVLNREVAIKEVLLPAELPAAERADLVARTMREAQAAARLNHPSLITIYDVVEYGGVPWIIMEFVDGRSLAAEISGSGALPWERVAAIGAQLADAIAHAHAHGIVHRDLKPDNVLLAGRRAVVADFGIARILDSASHLTRTGLVPGSPRYMAPEQLEGSPAGAQADMWSLGATLYTAVEGSAPFEGATLSAVYSGILTRDPPPPVHAGPLTDLLNALLAKDPERRPDAVATARLLERGFSPGASDDTPALPVTPIAATRLDATIPGAGSLAPTAEYPLGTGATAATAATGGTAASGERGRATPSRRNLILGGAAVLVAGAGGYAATRLAGGHAPARSTAGGDTTPPAASSPATAHPATSHPASSATPAAVRVKASLAYVLAGHTASVTSVAYHPMAGTLASGSADATVRLWNTATGSATGTLHGHSGAVNSVAFAADGAMVASGGADGTVRLWNPVSGAALATLTGHTDQVSSVAFSPAGTLLAGASRDGTIRLWDAASGALKGVVGTPGGGAPYGEYRLAFCARGATIASIFSAQTLQLWDVASATLKTTLRPSLPRNRFGAVGCSADGSTLATGGAPVQLWDLATGSARTLFPGPAWVTSLAFSPDDAILACGDHDNTVWLWAVANGKALATLTGHTDKVRAIAYRKDGTQVASGSGDTTVRLWTVSATG
jgi:hypothetical protein